MSDNESITSGGAPSGRPTEVTSEQMSEWKSILKPSKIHKADQARISQLSIITVLSERLGKLRRIDLTITEDRKFLLIKEEADEALSKAKHLNNSFISALTDQDPNNIKHPVFKADQDTYQDVLDSMYISLMEYDDLLNNTEGLRTAAAPVAADPTLITILDQLRQSTQLGIDSQTASAATAATNASALAAALDKLGDASQVLKPSQPHFNPQGNLEDYLRYKDWRRQFDLFIKRVPEDSWEDKSEWLKNSVKGKAFLLISSCSDDEAGYKGALVILDDKYKKTDYIREAMFDYIHNFKVPSPGKITNLKKLY